jgi:hypothetical protein
MIPVQISEGHPVCGAGQGGRAMPAWLPAEMTRRRGRADPALARAVGLCPRRGSRRGAHAISHNEGWRRETWLPTSLA